MTEERTPTFQPGDIVTPRYMLEEPLLVVEMALSRGREEYILCSHLQSDWPPQFYRSDGFKLVQKSAGKPAATPMMTDTLGNVRELKRRKD